MTPAESRQCASDLSAWFSKNGVECAGGDAGEMEPLEKTLGGEVDGVFAELVEKCGNGIW
jgi:hypothetical protein